MTIVSKGYPPTVGATGVEWSRHIRFGGRRYTVESGCRVTAVAGQTRTLSVSKGLCSGHGVLDEITVAETVVLPQSSSDTYYMVVLRRDWTSKESTLVAIPAGTAGATTLPVRQTDPGKTQDDQPLAMVRQPAGAVLPVVSTDLRIFGEGGIQQAAADMVRQYADWTGAAIRIGGSTGRLWERVIGSSGALEWRRDPGPFGRVELPVLSGSQVVRQEAGWSVTGEVPFTNRLVWDGNTAHFHLEIQKTTSNLVFGLSGGLKDVHIATLLTGAPDMRVSAAGAYMVNSTGNYPVDLVLDSNGRVLLIAGPAGVTLEFTGSRQNIFADFIFVSSKREG